jgi:hypothetical protein
MFIAIDPGKNTGVATFNSDGSDLAKYVFQEDSFRLFMLGLLHIEGSVTFILEDFKLVKGKALEQTGSDMPAPRIIGAMQMVDTILGKNSEIVYVQPGNLRTALKWAGYSELANKPYGWHCPDDLSAYAHGVMYLIQQKLRPHPIFAAYKKNEG